MTAGITVKAVHLSEMRTALIAAYVQAEQPPPTFPPVTAVTTVIVVSDIAYAANGGQCAVVSFAKLGSGLAI